MPAMIQQTTLQTLQIKSFSYLVYFKFINKDSMQQGQKQDGTKM
jgi:hypothetical protein